MLSSCGTTPMAARDWRGFVSWSKPQMRTEPAVLTTSPARMLMKVDLPAPFGPSRPKIDPAGTSRSIPVSARLGAFPPLAA